MNSRGVKVTLMLVVAAVAAAGSYLLHQQNRQLRLRSAGLRSRSEAVAQLRADNRQLAETLAQTEKGNDATTRIHEQVIQLRQRVADLERRAQTRARELNRERQEADAALAANRDPKAAPMRLEHFENRGDASPENAFQTLVWATLKGDDATADKLCTFSPADLAHANALLAGLPAEARQRWTPEKLGALFFTEFFTEISAVQIGDVRENTDDHATMTLRIPGAPKDPQFEFVRVDGSWRVMVPAGVPNRLAKKIATP